MEARQLEAFLAIVEEGTVTGAAARVHVSQPALSQTLRGLERELGVELFHRVGRRLVRSAAGDALVGPARQVLRDLEQARRAVADVAGLSGGRLDVVALPTMAVDPVADLLGRFRRAHPAVQVGLLAPEDTPDALARVRDGRAELAVTDAETAADLVLVPLGEQHYRAVFPPGTAPAGGSGRRIRPSVLAGLPFVTTPPGTSSRRLLERAHEDAGVEPVIAVEAGPRDALLPLVLAGAGVALLPAPLAAEGAALGAEVRDLVPPVRRAVTLAHRDAPLSPAAAAFLQLTGAR